MTDKPLQVQYAPVTWNTRVSEMQRKNVFAIDGVDVVLVSDLNARLLQLDERIQKKSKEELVNSHLVHLWFLELLAELKE